MEDITLSMIVSLEARLRILKAKLTGSEVLKYSTWNDVMYEIFKPYGRHKGRRRNAIKKRMRFQREGDLVRVDIDGKMIYWPIGAHIENVASLYFEAYSKKNNHYFDIDGMEIKKGDIVLDCGTCEGWFARKALDAGVEKVYCVEPGPSMVKCLEKTFSDEISSGRVSLSSCLLGNKNEVVAYYENSIDPQVGQIVKVDHRNSSALPTIETSMLTIDEFCNRQAVQRLDFIKADVEGSELDLIYGAERTIKKFRPALAIAVYHEPENANRVAGFVEGLSLGYTIRVKGILDKDRVPRPVMVHCYLK